MFRRIGSGANTRSLKDFMDEELVDWEAKFDLPASSETKMVQILPDPRNFTRLEVVDENGRAYSRRDCGISLSVQDDGRTFKIFVKPRERS